MFLTSSSSSSRAGSLVFNPVNAWLVTRFGWRVAFRVASGMIFFTGIVCCWTFSDKGTARMHQLRDDDVSVEQAHTETDESEAQVNEASEEEARYRRTCCTWAEVRARPEIVMWYFANGLSYLGFFMPFMNLAYYMNLHNISPQKGSFALTMLSFAECVTYITASVIGDRIKGA